MESFGERLHRTVAGRGPLCIGIDPHPGLLEQWGLPDDPTGLERFARTVVDALADRVAVVKPQSAFFERFGSRGIHVLESTIRQSKEAGAVVLLDVKRGDIGTTMAAYANAYLDPASPLCADAITVSPYLGVGSLQPAFDTAAAHGGGVFVLALTSNPEGAEVQTAVTPAGRTVAQSVVDAVADRNVNRHPLGHIGVVIGATAPVGALALEALNGPILAPGVGAQGATLADLPRVFGAAARYALPTTSRNLLRHGPDPAALKEAARRIADLATALLIPPLWQFDGGTPR